MEEATKYVINKAIELQINKTFAEQLSEHFIDPQFLYDFSCVSDYIGLTKEYLIKHIIKNKKDHKWIHQPGFKYEISESTYIDGKIDNNVFGSLDIIICLCAFIDTEKSKQFSEYCDETRKYLFTNAEKYDIPGLNPDDVRFYVYGFL
ncbi:MAG: hypothetical protein Terrestrivirus4_80 [Terrestrivirus sp.]|uniref:Uncharacterized protein n=1 Tax=Terrestrivirus sp. TaxID=2487775 RepID=A0A3G4ZME9_9VIRU|nr:MAG: hypothetical protein Terrestrivirus4_80 [Terrestrivirus sp.]